MNILIKPVITEKMNKLTEKLNRYGFVVARGANKLQIKDIDLDNVYSELEYFTRPIITKNIFDF